MIVFQKRI